MDTPLPIPNRVVKHFYGENSVSEDSKLPIFFCNNFNPFNEDFFNYLNLFISCANIIFRR